MNELLTSIALVLVGGILGLGSGLLVEQTRRRHAIVSKLFDEYIRIRDEVVGVLAELAIIAPGPATTDEALDEARRKISFFFYRYYDFLPENVLLDLGCLDACLAKRGKHLYRYDETRRLHRIDTKNVAGIARLARTLSMFTNVNHYAALVLAAPHSEKRCAAVVKYQARVTLGTLNETFTLRRILGWGKKLRKEVAH